MTHRARTHIGKVRGSQTRPLTHKPSLFSIGPHQNRSQHLFSHIIIHTTSDSASKTVYIIPTSLNRMGKHHDSRERGGSTPCLNSSNNGLEPSYYVLRGFALFLFDVMHFACPPQVSVFRCRKNRKVNFSISYA